MSRWETVTAICIWEGVIQLIEPNGTIGYYAQRGVHQLNQYQTKTAFEQGRLSAQALTLPELPANYSISFEDEEIMGKAEAKFNTKGL